MFVALLCHPLMSDETFSQAAAEATVGGFPTLIKGDMLCQSSGFAALRLNTHTVIIHQLLRS